MRAKLSADTGAGLVFLIFGAVFFWQGLGLNVGSAARMGAGHMPRVLCLLLIGTGGLLLARGLRGDGDLGRVPWRPLVFIVLAIVGFSLLIRSFGMLAACAVVSAVSSLASRESGVGEAILLAAGLAVAAAIIFSMMLGLNIPVLPPFLGRWDE